MNRKEKIDLLRSINLGVTPINVFKKKNLTLVHGFDEFIGFVDGVRVSEAEFRKQEEIQLKGGKMEGVTFGYLIDGEDPTNPNAKTVKI